MVKDNVNLMNIRYRTAERERDIALKELQITRQEQRLDRKNIWITGSVTGILALGAILIGVYRNHRQTKRFQASRIQMLQQEQEIATLKAMVRGEEKERTRMARELHDGIVSQLLVITLNVDSIYNKGEGMVPRGALESVLHQLKDATGELRRTAHNLLPGLLLENGLAVSVAALCEKTEKNTRITVDFQEYGIIPRLEPDIELSLYRMIQELIQNVLKHAGATHILVQMSCRNGLMSIAVEDNGSGFSANPALPEGKTGLYDIRGRVTSMNGTMEIQTGDQDHHGTAIYIELPVTDDAVTVNQAET
jgi:two-component system NarL family sensor kinase